MFNIPEPASVGGEAGCEGTCISSKIVYVSKFHCLRHWMCRASNTLRSFPFPATTINHIEKKVSPLVGRVVKRKFLEYSQLYWPWSLSVNWSRSAIPDRISLFQTINCNTWQKLSYPGKMDIYFSWAGSFCLKMSETGYISVIIAVVLFYCCCCCCCYKSSSLLCSYLMSKEVHIRF